MPFTHQCTGGAIYNLKNSHLSSERTNILPLNLLTDTYVCLGRIRGDQQHFVRRDELKAAWEIFTPLLHDIDAGRLKALPYQPGTRGPLEADELSKRMGYVPTLGYVWAPPTLAKF